MTFIVVLDACVLYPSLLRDLLIRISQTGLYRAKWTEKIHDEWVQALRKNRPDIPAEKLLRIRRLMNEAVPDSLITGYEALTEEVTLPDRDDRHVLAAALKAHADMIVTYNLTDFPAPYLHKMGIEVRHPDDFVLCQIDLNAELVFQAINKQLNGLRNPVLPVPQYLVALEKRGLMKTVSRLRELELTS